MELCRKPRVPSPAGDSRESSAVFPPVSRCVRVSQQRRVNTRPSVHERGVGAVWGVFADNGFLASRAKAAGQNYSRKNWIFANTPAGTQSSAVIYSLIETAKENDLNPYRCLVWLLQNVPGLSPTDEA